MYDGAMQEPREGSRRRKSSVAHQNRLFSKTKPFPVARAAADASTFDVNVMQEERQTIRTCSRIAKPNSQAYQASSVKFSSISPPISSNCCSTALQTVFVCAQSASSQSTPCFAPLCLIEPCDPCMVLQLDTTNVSIITVQLLQNTGNCIVVVESAQLQHVVSLLSSCPLMWA